MGDARIHFAINCASYSCHKLQNTAFTAANVNALMDKSEKEFINSDKNDFTDPNHPKLSSIFSFYPKRLYKERIDAGGIYQSICRY
jgi:hypothetical protein